MKRTSGIHASTAILARIVAGDYTAVHLERATAVHLYTPANRPFGMGNLAFITAVTKIDMPIFIISTDQRDDIKVSHRYNAVAVQAEIYPRCGILNGSIRFKVSFEIIIALRQCKIAVGFFPFLCVFPFAHHELTVVFVIPKRRPIGQSFPVFAAIYITASGMVSMLAVLFLHRQYSRIATADIVFTVVVSADIVSTVVVSADIVSTDIVSTDTAGSGIAASDVTPRGIAVVVIVRDIDIRSVLAAFRLLFRHRSYFLRI